MMQDPIVLHVLVIGFHHKKGCQVEFAYPPLCPDAPEAQGLELPDLWKHLPSLALPDGAHNYQKDTIYFHLPSLEKPHQTVFGVSCFRQMNSECLKNRSEDITRGSVQKSVCVLSLLPLYGLIQTKLELITHAYFEERDFSQVSLLEETYKHLNATLTNEQLWGSQLFLGLSVRDLILHFKHKVLVLFKLFLLERKVLFYKSPVEELCSTILTICSLFPGMLEKGLSESASGLGLKHAVPVVQENVVDTNFIEVTIVTDQVENRSSIQQNGLTSSSDSIDNAKTSGISSINSPIPGPKAKNSVCESTQRQKSADDICVHKSLEKRLSSDSVSANKTTVNMIHKEDNQCSGDNMEGREKRPDHKLSSNGPSSIRGSDNTTSNVSPNGSCLHHEDCGTPGVVNSKNCPGDGMAIEDELMKEIDELLLNGKEDESSKSEGVLEGTTDMSSLPSSSSLVTLDLESCGLPLAVFTKGSMCLPYLSLPFIESLGDLSVRSCVVGATNVLFKQKRNLFDVIVEIESGKIEVFDLDLSRQLHLTMEDLRFAENLVQHVTGENKDVFLDGTGWEGGDEWLRAQFKLYLLSLLKTADQNGSRELEAFNVSFVQAWQETHNFKVWGSGRQDYLGLLQTSPRHPYQKGQLSMADMKLKLSHSMQSTEKGRKINSAVASTGKAVLQTGRAVGGALTSARSFVSSWLTNITPPPSQPEVPSPTVDKSPEIEMKVIRTDSFSSELSEQS